MNHLIRGREGGWKCDSMLRACLKFEIIKTVSSDVKNDKKMLRTTRT